MSHMNGNLPMARSTAPPNAGAASRPESEMDAVLLGRTKNLKVSHTLAQYCAIFILRIIVIRPECIMYLLYRI